jgi:hypothetical protein
VWGAESNGSVEWAILLPGTQVTGLSLAKTKTLKMITSKQLTSENVFPAHKYNSFQASREEHQMKRIGFFSMKGSIDLTEASRD